MKKTASAWVDATHLYFTGDLVFTSGKHGIKKLIRIFTDPIGVLTHQYVPHHVGILRHDDGELWACEAQFGVGFVRVPFDKWIRAHRKDRPVVMRMEFTGARYHISNAIKNMEGTPYETINDFVKMATKRNPFDPQRVVCSTAIVRILQEAGRLHASLAMATSPLDPSNTNPDQLYEWGKSVGGVIKKIGLSK
jgi:hypothetical protein